MVQEDLEADFDSVSSSFDPRPHAAASLAVVHRATLVDRTDVAVKILRPQTEAGESLFTEDGQVALLDWGIRQRLSDLRTERRWLRRVGGPSAPTVDRGELLLVLPQQGLESSAGAP